VSVQCTRENPGDPDSATGEECPQQFARCEVRFGQRLIFIRGGESEHVDEEESKSPQEPERDAKPKTEREPDGKPQRQPRKRPKANVR
jgi:hypothetical protein